MANLKNHTIIIGRLCQTPELESRGMCEAFTEFSISHSTVKPNGEEEIMYHRIAAFNKQARIIVENLHKGDLCCIEGRIDQTFHEDKISILIVAEKITFLSSRKRPETVSCTEGE